MRAVIGRLGRGKCQKKKPTLIKRAKRIGWKDPILMTLRCKLPTIPCEPKQCTLWLMSASESTSTELICVYPGCKSSGRVFNRSYELERHKLIHFPNQKLACPIQDCKHKKTGKTFTRNDKFREHIATHGELALFRCPVSNCKPVQVKNGDFASHVANDHNILERYEIRSFLKSLGISCDKGRWACPLLCDFFAISTWNVRNHLEAHDLSERVGLESSTRFLGYPYSIARGKAKCPICKIQVCQEQGYADKFCKHLEHSHGYGDILQYSSELEWLLTMDCDSWWFRGCPVLSKWIREAPRTRKESLTVDPSTQKSPSMKFAIGFSGLPTDVKEQVRTTLDLDAAGEVSASGSFGGLDLEPLEASQSPWAQQSFMPSQTSLAEGLMVQQGCIAGQSLITEEKFVPSGILEQPQSLISQQAFLAPQSFIQTQAFTFPQTFMSAGVVQNLPMVPNSIPLFVSPGINVWHPFQPSPSSLGCNQYYPYGPNQLALLPNMNGYGVEIHQQGPSSFVPIPNSQPDEMGFGHHSEFDWAPSEAEQWGECSSNPREHPLHDSR